MKIKNQKAIETIKKKQRIVLDTMGNPDQSGLIKTTPASNIDIHPEESQVFAAKEFVDMNEK